MKVWPRKELSVQKELPDDMAISVLTKEKRLLFYGFSGLFTALNLWFLWQEMYWFAALPLALAVALLFFFSLDKLILTLVALTPFSFKLSDENLGFAIDLPVEPLIVAVMFLFFFRLIYERRYHRQILRHPLTVMLLVYLGWMLLTAFTSEIPLVSFKYFVSHLWFIVTFYFAGIYLFEKQENFHRFFWLFGSALVVVVIYATIAHAQLAFERKMAYASVHPFFNDHTHYAAVLALIAPFFIVSVFNRIHSVPKRVIALAFFLVFAMGILFSYSRAAWVSLIIALAGFIILAMRIKFRMLLAGMVMLVGSLFVFQTEIVMQLQRNNQESSGDFAEHARSISNITSDASNLERINRWRSAFRMFDERPLFGWGPGTYQLVYAPFQRYEDRTIITTNFGDLGNAHSEYIGPLAEQGLPGMLIFLTMALMILAYGVKQFKNAPSRNLRLTALGITLGFITYLVHGLLNNFLDTSEAAVLFWGMMAMLVGIDVFHSAPKVSAKAKPSASMTGQALSLQFTQPQ